MKDTSNRSAADTAELAELITARHRCLLRLRDVGRQQAVLIHDGDITQLLRMFADKQRVVDELQQVERQLDPFRDQDPERRVWQSEDVRCRCGQLIDAAQQLLDEILQQEKRSETELRVKRDEVAVKLQSMQLSNEARQAYGEHEAAEAFGLDLSS